MGEGGMEAGRGCFVVGVELSWRQIGPILFQAQLQQSNPNPGLKPYMGCLDLYQLKLDMK